MKAKAKAKAKAKMKRPAKKAIPLHLIL